MGVEKIGMISANILVKNFSVNLFGCDGPIGWICVLYLTVDCCEECIGSMNLTNQEVGGIPSQVLPCMAGEIERGMTYEGSTEGRGSFLASL
jgi:hypothetical protein